MKGWNSYRVTPSLPKQSFRDRWPEMEQEIRRTSGTMDPVIADRLSERLRQQKSGKGRTRMTNETDRGWLTRLEEQSRRKQEQFMDGIAAKLGRDRIRSAPEHPFRGAPDFWKEFNWPPEERITQFTANFEAAGGHVVRLSRREEVTRFIRDKAMEMSAATILRQQEEALDRLGLEESLPDALVLSWNEAADTDWRAVAARADFGVVMADYAAAYTGSITVKSAPHRPFGQPAADRADGYHSNRANGYPIRRDSRTVRSGRT